MPRKKKPLNDSPTRWRNIFKKYGLSKEDYERILLEQNGACFICQRSPFEIKPRRHLAVDHCHTTGTIRGLLCYSCNHRLLGYMIKDDIPKVERLLHYLTRNKSYGKVP